MLDDLRKWGWADYKIEMACGFSRGYVAQLRCSNISEMSYNRAARLFNFWEMEQESALANSTEVLGAGTAAR